MLLKRQQDAPSTPSSVTACLRTYETHALKEAAGRACSALARFDRQDVRPAVGYFVANAIVPDAVAQQWFS